MNLRLLFFVLLRVVPCLAPPPLEPFEISDGNGDKNLRCNKYAKMKPQVRCPKMTVGGLTVAKRCPVECKGIGASGISFQIEPGGSALTCEIYVARNPTARCSKKTFPDGKLIRSLCPVQCSNGPPPPVTTKAPPKTSTTPPLTTEAPPKSSTTPPLTTEKPPMTSPTPPFTTTDPPPGTTPPNNQKPPKDPPPNPNLNPPLGTGRWGGPFKMSLIGLHALLTPTGEVLSYGSDDKGKQSGELYFELWEQPKTFIRAFKLLSKAGQTTDTFCSALNIEKDGNIIIMGGDVRGEGGKPGRGVADCLRMDPVTRSITPHPDGDMAHPRWYPTSVTLPEPHGAVFISGGNQPDGKDGKKGSPVPELYEPGKGFRELFGARVPEMATSKSWWYPHTYVNSEAEIILFLPDGENEKIYRVDIRGRGLLVQIGVKPFDAHTRTPSIHYRKDKVAFLDDKGDIYLADMSNSKKVTWARGPRTGRRRRNGSMVLLPTGEVAILGGCSGDGGGNDLDEAEKSIQFWHPDTNVLKQGPPEFHARLYHSVALIMPDGSIYSGAGGAPGPKKQLNGELYFPWYFKERRPVITQFPRNIMSGASTTFILKVSSGAPIAQVTAIKSGSASHTRNCDTKWLSLRFVKVKGSNEELIVWAEHKNVLIFGVYMVSAVDQRGVPSEGVLIQVDMDH